MAQDSGTPKFPSPIPNPLSKRPSEIDRSVDHSDEKTDPNLVIPKAIPSSNLVQSLQAPPLVPQNPPQPLPKVKMPEMGLLDGLMKDPSITEIMVNDVRNVMIEKAGTLQVSGIVFQSLDELNRLARN